MAASITWNRETPWAAMWWLLEGALVAVYLADTTGASPAPSLEGNFSDWFDYFQEDPQFDVFLNVGAVSYDATQTDRAVVPQIEIVLDYSETVTYTHLFIEIGPVYYATAHPDGAELPAGRIPTLAIVSEPAAVTLTAGDTKTYKIDLFSEWL